jgi:hypothetical protein
MVPEKLSILNKHKICGKRDKLNSFSKMGRPVNGVCTRSVESGVSYKPEPCVGTSTDADSMFCIPLKAKGCPITNVSFS